MKKQFIKLFFFIKKMEPRKFLSSGEKNARRTTKEKRHAMAKKRHTNILYIFNNI